MGALPPACPHAIGGGTEPTQASNRPNCSIPCPRPRVCFGCGDTHHLIGNFPSKRSGPMPPPGGGTCQLHTAAGASQPPANNQAVPWRAQPAAVASLNWCAGMNGAGSLFMAEMEDQMSSTKLVEATTKVTALFNVYPGDGKPESGVQSIPLLVNSGFLNRSSCDALMHVSICNAFLLAFNVAPTPLPNQHQECEYRPRGGHGDVPSNVDCEWRP